MRIWKTGTSGGRTWAESEAEWVGLTGTCGAKNYVGCDKAIDAPALPGTDRDTFMFTIYCRVKKCLFVWFRLFGVYILIHTNLNHLL